eukprot:6464593-Amphidinium_carterae.1
MRLIQHCRLEVLKKRDAGEDTKVKTKELVDAENLVCRCKTQSVLNKQEASDWMASLDTRMDILKESWGLQPVKAKAKAKAKALPKADVVEAAAAGAVAESAEVEEGDAEPKAASAADAEVEAGSEGVGEAELAGSELGKSSAGEPGVSPPVTTKRL